MGGLGAVACGGVRRSAGAGAVAVAGRAGRAGVIRNRAGRGANRRAGISTGLFNNPVDFAQPCKASS